MKMTIIKVSILAIGIATLVIIALSSCSMSRRSGCPVNAQYGFGPGRIR